MGVDRRSGLTHQEFLRMAVGERSPMASRMTRLGPAPESGPGLVVAPEPLRLSSLVTVAGLLLRALR